MITKQLLMSAAGILVAAALWPVSTSAEGYQVNTISARQTGMGHTGFALKLGSESQLFNPAGMAFMENKVDASASFTAIFANAKATVGGKAYKTDNTPATPIGVFGAFSINDNLKAGVSFYTPYGSSINWTEDWPGATLNQKVSLKAFTFQPTISWRILPKLSVGAGLMLTWGNVDLHKGLISASQLDAMLAAMGSTHRFGEITPASVALNGKANVAAGVNLGAMYDFSDSFTAGINFRSKSLLKVKSGMTEVSYATSDPVILGMLSSKLDGISKTEFSAEMPCPATLGFGGSWHNSRLTATAEAQLTFWKTYKSLDIAFKGAPQFDQHLAKNYHNAWLMRGGVEWKANSQLDLRAGLVVDLSPCDKEYYNPETPGMTKIEPTLGLTFRPIPSLGISAGFMYIQGLGMNNASYTTPNVLTGTPDKFTADYKTNAFVGSIGMSVSF